MKASPVCKGLALALFLSAASSWADSVSGTVTNKTTNRASAGDTVTLVDLQAGMSDAAHTTTDSSGRYSLSTPSTGPYLIRVTHQGAAYFIAAPMGGAPGDVTVYDVAAKVDGVGVDAYMLLIEAGGGTLRVHERYLIRNTSLPPKAQYSDKTFEVALPSGAELDMASTSRPGGMGTNTRLVPLADKGHYTFNTPIQPNKDEKETMFELQYHLSYDGKYTFHPSILTPADNFVVYLAPGIDFSGAQGASFEPRQEDPKVKTFAAKNVQTGQNISFTVSGEGQMASNPQPAGANGMVPASGQPGGGIGAPINTPDPLSENKWWILGSMAILLAAAAVFLLRRGKVGVSGNSVAVLDEVPVIAPRAPQAPSPVASNPNAAVAAAPAQGALLNTIKEELFKLESERLAGALTEEDYATAKAGLEAILKRALKG